MRNPSRLLKLHLTSPDKKIALDKVRLSRKKAGPDVSRRTDSRRMLENLRAVGDTNVREDEGELWLSESIDAAKFAEADRLLTQWIRLLKKKGGLKASLE
jgi:hypothetical protein